ncbi:hypothetical protein [Alteromonas stellipolaris]|uniref:hypothetical protein n=1 Tax=Alteromonas stellipolaris TaxID=233316 RepID=UPI002735E4F2|nr:hypothetical protein [Alteromonas stellipolaris]MDP2534834.1 hypothetical protein [Alteromonas stellipolaris]
MRQFLLGLFLSTLLGAAILFFSPYFIGEIEPWISDSYYYTGALVLAGFIVLIDRHASYESVFIGIMLGQAIYMFTFIPVDSLVGVALVIMAFKSLLSCVGLLLKSALINILYVIKGDA